MMGIDFHGVQKFRGSARIVLASQALPAEIPGSKRVLGFCNS
jgi:hypothetical protein